MVVKLKASSKPSMNVNMHSWTAYDFKSSYNFIYRLYWVIFIFLYSKCNHDTL